MVCNVLALIALAANARILIYLEKEIRIFIRSWKDTRKQLLILLSLLLVFDGRCKSNHQLKLTENP